MPHGALRLEILINDLRRGSSILRLGLFCKWFIVSALRGGSSGWTRNRWRRATRGAALPDGQPGETRPSEGMAPQAGLGTAGAERREARRFPMDSLGRRDRAKRGNGSPHWTISATGWGWAWRPAKWK